MKYEYVRSDCMGYLQSLPDESVDLILTEPPHYVWRQRTRRQEGQIPRQWRTEEEYLDWSYEWTKELVRILKPGRLMLIWGEIRNITFLKYRVSVMDSFKELYPQNDLVASHNWGTSPARNNFRYKHMVAWSSSKGKEFLFNYDQVAYDPWTNELVTKPQTPGRARQSLPTCVWDYSKNPWDKDFRNYGLDSYVLSEIITAYTNPGDVILDPFMGKATTAMEAMKLNRDFLGCELDRKQYEIGMANIAATKVSLM